VIGKAKGDQNTANMQRSARSRPVSQHGQAQTGSQQAVQQRPMRKIFNCIVDDTALVAGVKKATRNGIRQWVKNGQIRLFVPLHGKRAKSITMTGSGRY